MPLTVCIPVDAHGQVDPRWGRAAQVATAHLAGGAVQDWTVHPVGWDVQHDLAGEGQHHARVARFLMEQQVTDVVAGHMGEGMRVMLSRMGIRLHLGAAGEARALLEALAKHGDGEG